MNLELYNKVREVPKEAQKTIKGGRLNGYTDINPMWRIKTLTEHFGVCGFGWYYEIVEKWIETSMSSEVITANVIINLYVRVDGEWSKPIQGVGGSELIKSEKSGLYTNDECYKMALTDAISVACKALGFGADVYWQGDKTKYDRPQLNDVELATDLEKKTFMDLCGVLGVDYKDILKQVGVKDKMTKQQHGKALIILRDIENAQKGQK